MSDPNLLWSFILLLTGVVGQDVQLVQYPLTSVCAVRGSTITLPCTFTPLESFMRDGISIPLKVVRVLWCVNHKICHGQTPSVFDSNSTSNNPRYQYLGDMKGNCSLQIRDVMDRNEATFRFRMEADNSAGHFTGQTGVNVSVSEGTTMRINSSSENTEFRRGQAVSLLCTSSRCTINQLEITWMKDGHALSETGPALQFNPLTMEDSGNYTCVLKANSETWSEPFRLQVEEEEEGDSDLPLILGVVFGVLLAVITLILVIVIIKRKRAAVSHDAVGGEAELKPADIIYSSILPPAEDNAGHRGVRQAEDFSYASVQFRHNKPSRKEEAAAEAIIYSSIITRG